MIVAFLIALQSKVHAASPIVIPLTPSDNSYATSTVSLSSRVDGLEPSQYEMFWAIGDGEWNRMTTNVSTKLSSATIDIANWNWRSDKRYTIRFIALQKSNWTPIEQSIVINKGEAPSTSVQPSLPLVGAPVAIDKLFVDPQTVPAQKLAASPSNPALQTIATQPMAQWFGDWNYSVKDDVKAYVDRASTAEAIPTLVLYNIPKRDCGSYSAGGAKTQTQYLEWVRQVKEGLGNRKAIVIVEPDALASMDCLSSAEKSQRMNAIADTVKIVKNDTTNVYIDAGHASWHSTSTIASRLRSAGVEAADGFSLNISNFRTTNESTSYGMSIASKIGNNHFVIDTS
ncbi:glycoside hydrolase family 6 protein, partial [Candidatus Saccharibacteria bacterium]|nr:glycoside hydrolase family 6 protein [Candidatus Saccharibacteria bacterium]